MKELCEMSAAFLYKHFFHRHINTQNNTVCSDTWCVILSMFVAVEKGLVNAADISYGRPLPKNLCVTFQGLCVESVSWYATNGVFGCAV
jgi:hypothetical protein